MSHIKVKKILYLHGLTESKENYFELATPAHMCAIHKKSWKTDRGFDFIFQHR